MVWQRTEYNGVLSAEAGNTQSFGATRRFPTTVTGPYELRIHRRLIDYLHCPSSPKQGSAEQAFGRVEIPWMLMTGTKDFGLVVGADPEFRMKVFPALTPDNKYELVLDRAEYSAFSDRALPGDSSRSVLEANDRWQTA
jgi:hypothetical protein